VRADAQRNRARILEAAFAAFASEGLGVSVHEIARRAGVGTGTVSRHFPTKEALFEAIIRDRAESVVAQAGALQDSHAGDPAGTLFAFVALLARELAADRGLAMAMAGAGIDLEAAAGGPGSDITATIAALLDRAQQAGAIRPDVQAADVKALMMGCVDDLPEPPGPGLDRRLGIVFAGLRPR